MGCLPHGRLFCDECSHTSTHLEVTEYFTQQLFRAQNAGRLDYWAVKGMLWEYNNMMAKV